MNEWRKTLIESLAELGRDLPNNNPIGYSSKEFNEESNNVQQAQANTIIKLLIKICIKLEYLEDRLIIL